MVGSQVKKLRLGVAGLGRAFMLMLPTLGRDPRMRLVAAADPRPEARAAFERDFSSPGMRARAYATVAELAADPDVEAVYVATPHQLHVAHVATLAAGGKHLLVEKPMALTLADCTQMIEAAAAARVHLLVGHSHSFDTPYLETAKLIASGRYGPVRMITALNFTDFLYRPRRPEELSTADGGGVVFSQAAHQVDVVRLLGGSEVARVRAVTGNWDPARPTEGAYQALLTFAGGATACLTYSGYGRFDTDELMGWVGELGQPRDQHTYGTARAALHCVTSAADETALKARRTYGVAAGDAAGAARSPDSGGALALHNHFGVIIVSCADADLRPMPDGVQVFGNSTREFMPLPPPAIPRFEVVDELIAAVRHNQPPLHSGSWGRATLDVCLGILDSAATGQEIRLACQTGGGNR
jgi:phthalate 4,5-cis-dihydrodiol dehydrogenase